MNVSETRRISNNRIRNKVPLDTRFPTTLNHFVGHFTSLTDFPGLEGFETRDEARVADHVLVLVMGSRLGRTDMSSAGSPPMEKNSRPVSSMKDWKVG